MCNRCQLRDEIESGRNIQEVPIDCLRDLTVDFDMCFNYRHDPDAKVYFRAIDEINRRASLKKKSFDRSFYG